MSLTTQVFKQGPGACHDNGEVMEPGWYFCFERESLATPPFGEAPARIAFGQCYGPHPTKRAAQVAARTALRDLK
jgi:hypothetical protein